MRSSLIILLLLHFQTHLSDHGQEIAALRSTALKRRGVLLGSPSVNLSKKPWKFRFYNKLLGAAQPFGFAAPTFIIGPF
jgi:hypothetical protein